MYTIRSARKSELPAIARLITDRFWGLEQHTLLARGLSNPKEFLTRTTQMSLPLFFAKGDILVSGENELQGALVGIPAKRFTLLHMLVYSLGSSRLIGKPSKADAAAIRKNAILQEKVHDRNWYRKYTKCAYYINWIAVAVECKGTGLFRCLLSPVLEKCAQQRMDVVLETFTQSNVPIYEHFGFQLVETHTSDETPLTEYCLIKYNR